VLQTAVAATSVGVVDGSVLLDLNYREDVSAAVDCNLVMTAAGRWVEVQATGEDDTYTEEQLTEMLRLGRRGIERLFELQRDALEPEPA
jgi:ribonuclease PH